MVCIDICCLTALPVCFRTVLASVIRFSDWQLYPSYDPSFILLGKYLWDHAHYEVGIPHIDAAAYIDVSGLKWLTTPWSPCFRKSLNA